MATYYSICIHGVQLLKDAKSNHSIRKFETRCNWKPFCRKESVCWHEMHGPHFAIGGQYRRKTDLHKFDFLFRTLLRSVVCFLLATFWLQVREGRDAWTVGSLGPAGIRTNPLFTRKRKPQRRAGHSCAALYETWRRKEYIHYIELIRNVDWSSWADEFKDGVTKQQVLWNSPTRVSPTNSTRPPALHGFSPHP